ncbi:MAG: amidohydrolase family protein [Oscillospiraceae bacterium]|nr:amidohydrolase family protein [Oscillospiraceae bacterium]
MTTILRGNIIHAPAFGALETIPRGFLVLEDGVLKGLYPVLPEKYRSCPAMDYGEALIMPSFADLHLHAPQYPMLGMGMDLPLLEWLDTYTFRTEARFADVDYARRVYRQLAWDLISSGTTRAAIFSSRHTDATLILMEELERAGVAGYVGKVNMDRNGGAAEEGTEESLSETLRWLENCRFDLVKPILTPRFTPSCTDELMAALGKLARERDLPVQSHLSENSGEVAWVGQLHPDCSRYWESYAKFGLWKDRTLMAHCVHSDAREQDAMAEAGVWAVHCAASNVNLCSGTAPVRELLDRGVRVALGSDISGGDQLAMNRVIVMSIRASKIKQIETGAPFLSVPEAYYLGSTAGHVYFGGGAGFQPGHKLHAIVADDSQMPAPARELTLAERFERTVYLMEKRHILAVYSEGVERLHSAGQPVL